jgi:anaerobic selenocysteine-containing dehydrogenase
VIRVAGDPDHPPTHGALCTKVSRYAERTYHPERVLTPLRRVGPKGSGRFEPVSWDEALDDIARACKAIAARDPQAILPYSYAGTMGLVQGEAWRRASSTGWAPACWTAPSAPAPAARR